MVKTIIHTKSEDLQISRLNEFFLVANRIRRAGRCSRQGFSKPRSRPNLSGGGARLPVQLSSVVPPSANRSLRGNLAQQGREERDPSTGELGRLQQHGKMSTSKRDRASDHGEERRRFARRFPPMDISDDQPPRQFTAIYNERSRGGRQSSFLLGTLEAPLSFASHFRNPFLLLSGIDRIRKAEGALPQGKW
jgi:hypothetical protein